MNVDFYVLKTGNATAGLLLACRLAEKAYATGNTAYVYCDTPQNAQSFDQLLWTFKEEAFIPHALKQQTAAAKAPIVIGCDLKNLDRDYDILINLHPEMVSALPPFQRILDIVANDAVLKERGRQRYKQYRNAQYPLNLHEL